MHLKPQKITEIDNKLQLDINCVFCGTAKSVSVMSEQYKLYQQGMKIQDAFPTLSDDDRELIMSHICSTCFDEKFHE